LLQKYLGWGYTAAVAGDEEKRSLIFTAVCDALTDLCLEFKQLVS
jgi:hypothetical protein